MQVRAHEQAERIKQLKLFPEMIADYKHSEDEIVKLEYDCMETEQRIAVTINNLSCPSLALT